MKMLRVAAYCRVSTVNTDQLNSLENQKLYFDKYIRRHDNWTFEGLYADEGLTGTSLKKRDRFNHMVNNALQGKVDLIITKDVSRFARNTVDLLSTTRRLSANGIGVLFTEDNIDTRESEGELRLSIMAVFAQEESRKTSERVKWGMKRAAEQGIVISSGVYGFFLNKGVLTVNDDEAVTVRRIFYEFLIERKGTPRIAKEFNENGIPCGKAKKWTCLKIIRILRDERNIGDLIQRKTHVESHLTHKPVVSAPEDWIVIKDHHEPIIDGKIFYAAQEELKRRAALVKSKSCHSGRHWASGLVKCGVCGGAAISRNKRNKDGSLIRFWRCKAGDSNLINNEALLMCVKMAVCEVNADRGAILKELNDRIKEARLATPADTKFAETKVDGLRKKIRRVLDLYVEENITKEEMQNQKQHYNEELLYWTSEIERLQCDQEIQCKTMSDTVAIMDRIKDVIAQKDPTPTVYSHILDKIVLYKNYCLDVYFKYIDTPVKLQYKTSGKKATYRIECSVRKNETVNILSIT
jgi:DNA invertase Pin-like site-specific DNA recombinase